MAKLRSTQTCLRDPRVSTKGAVLQPLLIRSEGSKATSADGFHGSHRAPDPTALPFPACEQKTRDTLERWDLTLGSEEVF
jgi:hypothetical protein